MRLNKLFKLISLCLVVFLISSCSEDISNQESVVAKEDILKAILFANNEIADQIPELESKKRDFQKLLQISDHDINESIDELFQRFKADYSEEVQGFYSALESENPYEVKTNIYKVYEAFHNLAIVLQGEYLSSGKEEISKLIENGIITEQDLTNLRNYVDARDFEKIIELSNEIDRKILAQEDIMHPEMAETRVPNIGFVITCFYAAGVVIVAGIVIDVAVAFGVVLGGAVAVAVVQTVEITVDNEEFAPGPGTELMLESLTSSILTLL